MFGAIAFSLALAAAVPPSAEEVPPGTPIVSIVVERHDVFDTDAPGTTAWPYRAANFLHILTRERFIRSQLLFEVGDPLDPELLEESARILREHGFLSPVETRVRAVPGGCEVMVETRDQWTTQVGLNYGAFGRRRHAGFALAEQNLLGWGKQLLLDVDRQDERNTVTLRFRDPLFLGRRLRLELERSNATDGSVDALAVESSFFSLATPRAGALRWERGRRTQWLYVRGEKAVSGSVHSRSGVVWGGLRLPGEGPVTRIRLGFFREKVRYGPWAWTDGAAYEKPVDRDMAGVLFGVERQPPRWVVTHGLRGWQRQEDAPLGASWSATLGGSLPVFGADRRRLLVQADARYALQSGRWYGWVEAAASGRVEAAGWVDGLVHLAVAGAQPGEQGWRGRIVGDWGHKLEHDRQVTLGADVGLRGWDPDFFDGTSRVVANLEWRRRLTGEVLHLGVIGVTVFADAGRTWGARIGEPTRRWRADAGAGLLIELTRASIARSVRLEVALPDDGRGPVLLATSSSLF
ncbi:MAG TPA: hypothetical protein P5234_01935 [Thermoanaerobaculaceae bacterium]|nr:hypothetical protein [Thermoanaerobaculaceae bacterium]HRS14988.1 hypothetical protein [Thermoanaerobaculaceae bacterium]